MSSLKDLYSFNKDPKFEKYMDLLFPNSGTEEYTNFGYWENVKFPNDHLEVNSRIKSQSDLYKFVLNEIDIMDNDVVLEVGCGKGGTVNYLCNEGIICYGIDALENQISECRSRHPSYKNQFVIGKAESIPFINDYFDKIYSLEAAQHFESFQNFTHELHRVLRRHGNFCVSTFFLTSEKHRQSVEQIIPPTIEGTDKIISIDEAVSNFQQAGFSKLNVNKIGKYVFPQFGKWQKIVMKSLNYPPPPKGKEQWSTYFSIDKNDTLHPWEIAFNKGFIDYYTINNKPFQN